MQQSAEQCSGNKLFAEPRSISDIADCFFYHAVDIPGLGHVPGEWDLREGIEQYLGNVDFKGKHVLDVGAATGFVTFSMETRGADVVAFDVNEDYLVDYIPYSQHDHGAFAIANKPNIRKMNNSFWFCHDRFGSRSKMVYGTVYAVPEELGLFDVSTFGCILLHLRDPFIALFNVLRHTKETVIVTLPHPSIYFAPDYVSDSDCDKPMMIFLPDAGNKENVQFGTWWALTPEVIRKFIAVLGFEDATVSHHIQKNGDYQFQLYTVVGRRTVALS